MPRSTSRLLSAAIAVVLALALASCGSSEESPSSAWSFGPEQTGRDAEDQSGSDARAFMVMVSDAQAEIQTVTMDLTMSIGDQEFVAQAQTRVGEDPTHADMAMTMDVPGAGTIEMRFVDQVMYLRLGTDTEDKFVRIDADDELLGEDFALMLDQMDPRAQIALMKDAVVDFRQEGTTETIDGVEATPYVVVLDTATVVELSQIPVEDLEAAGLPDSLEYTIFIGSDDLPRRIMTDAIGTETVMEFSRWGEDVVIEAPSPDQIMEGDFEDLLSEAA